MCSIMIALAPRCARPLAPFSCAGHLVEPITHHHSPPPPSASPHNTHLFTLPHFRTLWGALRAPPSPMLIWSTAGGKTRLSLRAAPTRAYRRAIGTVFCLLS